MANEQAFDSGLDLGYNRGSEGRLRKQALSDQELQGKISDLIDERKNLQTKYSSTLDANGQPTSATGDISNALQTNAASIREIYHPDKNPGAVAKFGNLLMDAFHLSSPQKQQQKADAVKAKEAAADKASAQRAETGAPLSPEQEAMQKIQAQLNVIEKANLSSEDKEEARRALFKLSNRPVYKTFKLADGTYAPFDITRPDLIPSGASLYVAENTDTKQREDFAKYQKDNPDYKGTYLSWVAEQKALGRPSTSSENEYADTYAKAYGLKNRYDLTTEDWDYIKRKVAFDKAIPTSTTTTSLKQNADNQWVPVQEVNTKNPGAGAPVPPRGKPVNNVPPPRLAPSGGAPMQSTPAPPPSLPQLKNEAKGREPKAPQSGNVSVGQPLFAAPNKEYNDAKSALTAATHRDKIMHKNLQEAMKGDQQAMLSLVANHIGMTLGAQKGARINQAVWNEAVASRSWLQGAEARWGPDGLLSGVTLSPEQMRQMVKLADETLEVTKQDLQGIVDRLNTGAKFPIGGGSPAASGDADVDAIVKALNQGK